MSDTVEALTNNLSTPVESAPPQIANRAGSRRNRWFFLLSLAIILFTTALQLKCLKGEAVIDDKRLISDFEGRGCGANPIDCFHEMMFGFYYRPVLSASIAVGQKLHDNRPLWFHAENLVLHALAVTMALWMFRLLFRRRVTALLAGLFFAIQPIQVLYTTFIGGRTESMVAISILLFAIGVHNAGRRLSLLKRVYGPAAAAKIALWILVSIIGVLGAAFSKEQVLPIVLLTPLFAMPMRPRQQKRSRGARASKPRARRLQVARKSPPYWTAIYILPVAVFVLAARSALHDIDYVEAPWSHALHIEMVGRTLWSYTKIYLFPTVSTQHISTLGAWEPLQLIVALLGYAAAIAWCVLFMRNWSNRPRRILMLWAMLGIFACLNVIPVPTQFASAYRAGIPLFGISGLVASLLAPDTERRPRVLQRRTVIGARAALVGLIVAWCTIVTIEDVPNWHDEFVLMKAEVAADPNFVCARAALGDFDLQHGENDEALRQFDRCIGQLFGADASPDRYPEMVRSAGMVRTLQSASTLRYYRPVQYIPQIIRERGKTLLLLHRPAEALPDLRAALLLNQSDAAARNALAASYHALHQENRAEAVLRMDDVLLGRKL